MQAHRLDERARVIAFVGNDVAGRKTGYELLGSYHVVFLAWAADPKLEERKQLGLSVMIFLLLFSGILYASYRAIWRGVDHG